MYFLLSLVFCKGRRERENRLNYIDVITMCLFTSEGGFSTSALLLLVTIKEKLVTSLIMLALGLIASVDNQYAFLLFS